MILKFQKQAYRRVPNPERPDPQYDRTIPAGAHWIVFGEVSEVEYGDGDHFEVDESDISNDGRLTRHMLFDGPARPCVVVHDDEQDCPIFRLIWFTQNGERKVGRTQLPVYLCSDKGDTIEKI